MTPPDRIFTRDGALHVPTGHARGPWDPRQQHGGAPAALLARELDGLAAGMAVRRVTYEFLGPVPLAPCSVRAEVVRPGRRFQLAEAQLEVEGRVALRARAVLLRRADLPVDVPDGRQDVPGPEAGRPSPGWGPEGEDAFHRTGMEIRFLDRSPGRARAWFRLAVPFDDGPEPLPPVAAAVAAADFGNGVSRSLDFATHLFVNTDLTVHLVAEPPTEWVLLDSTTVVGAEGSGLASSVLRGEDGRLVGNAHQTLFVDER